MPMKKLSLTFTSACLFFVVALSGCHLGKQASVAYVTSFRHPRFINGIYLNGHNKSSATANAIEPTENPVFIDHPELSIEVVNNEKNGLFDLSPDNMVCVKYAEMIGLDCQKISNFQLYKFIDKWYGTNYRLGGQDESGIDCSAFSKKLYDEVYGVEITRTAFEQYKSCKRVRQTTAAEEGDLIFFRTRNKRISHVGVYLANNYFIHASTSHGVIISCLDNSYWHKRYATIGKISRKETEREEEL